ncbi:MAG: hypothetical protein P8J45_10135 [Phycisphaerales bacterium]|jgi:MYXO-CTERM domain-containing protein|nr:hypothetical protein [Phycisphaerales bacterium]
MFGHIVALGSVLAATGLASADLVNPLVPDWAGDATAETFTWNSFTQANSAPNFPDAPFSTDAQLFNFGPGAIIAGSGNIYNPAGGLNIHVYGSGPVGQAVLNFATLGTEFNYENVRLYLSDGAGSSETIFGVGEERSREGGAFGSDNVTMAYSWDVNVGFDVVEWAFFFGSDASNSSLDAVSVAVNSVPAPGGLLAVGLFGTMRRRRN